jgi:hypothetical protein
MAEKLRMAAAWQAEHHPVDASTVDRWHVIFDKGPKIGRDKCADLE